MPNRSQIQTRIQALKSVRAENTVRLEFLAQLSRLTKRDTILYVAHGSHSIVADDVQRFMAAMNGLKGSKLDLILHSNGGSMEAAEQIVIYLRSKYNHIRAIVPQKAMSAATMIACACDEIMMGRYSAIGPIDPQIYLHDFPGTIPAQAILDEFEQAKEDIANDLHSAPLWFKKIDPYPPGILKVCSATLALSRKLVADWLALYMLKGSPKKATQIADWLGDNQLHKTHGRPIMATEATSKGLKIIKMETDQKIQDLVLSIFHATMETFEVSRCVKIVENHEGRSTQLFAR